MDDVLLDLPSLDRDVRRAAERIERIRRELATPEGRAAARDADPFAGARHVAGQTTYRGIAALDPSPHQAALLRWMYELLQTRVGWDLELDEADALHARDERLLTTFAEAWGSILARDPREHAIDRAAELAAPIAAVRNERRARRAEVAHRLGLADPMAPGSPLATDKLLAIANAVLAATDGIARDVLHEAEKKHDRRWSPEDTIHLALAKDAPDGWPAKLGSRWLGEVFSALTTRAIEPRRLPQALGGASFVVAAIAWGSALRVASTPRGLPFALAFDPYPTMDLRFGHTIAIAMTEPVFHRRALGLPARIATAQSRALRTTVLFGVRTVATRFILATHTRPDPSLFEELTHRIFGAPLPEALAGAWPEIDPREPSRLLGMVTAFTLASRLRERFDEDWFANPRAGAHLAQIGCAPAWDPDVPEDGVARAIGRAFEEALG